MTQYGVIYYTRTNNSKRVAGKIANKLSCDLIQITDNINWQGIIGYIKAGFYSTIDKHVDIEFHGNIDGAAETIIVSPIWAGKLAPAVRTLLNKLPREKVHLVVTSIESQVKDRVGYLSVHHISSKTGNEDQVIEELVNSLLNA